MKVFLPCSKDDRGGQGDDDKGTVLLSPIQNWVTKEPSLCHQSELILELSRVRLSDEQGNDPGDHADHGHASQNDDICA